MAKNLSGQPYNSLTNTMLALSPKYNQIVEQILDEIRVGKYKVGDRLPTEMRLMEAYGVSRHTVRQALQNLKNMGVVEARQGRGWTVISTITTPSFIERIQSVEELLEIGGDLTRSLLGKHHSSADATLAREFGVEVGRELIEFDLLRYAGKDRRFPVAYLKVWIDPLFERIVELVQTDGRTMAELMQIYFNMKIGTIRQTITARGLDTITAANLKRPVGESALHVERQYAQSADAPAHLKTISICRGDLVQIESHFQAR